MGHSRLFLPKICLNTAGLLPARVELGTVDEAQPQAVQTPVLNATENGPNEK
jgi:hypothetical protein